MQTTINSLPSENGPLFLVYAGMETDLIFSKDMELPGFASYPLLETAKGRSLISQYFKEMIDLGKKAGVGVILESPTWVANKERGKELGYSAETLRTLNQHAIALMVEARSLNGDVPTLISGNIGPSTDAYAPSAQMSAKEATDFHADQIGALAKTALDLISGYTIAYPNEAIGMVEASKQAGLPVVIAFTVETDGRLPTGMTLGDAIATVDAATNSYAAYYMINCAHPDHFENTLTDAPWMSRLGGIVANASRCSHAELDNSTELDAGDPIELGSQLAAFRNRFPQIAVLGGCCGTDMRHIESIATAVAHNRSAK